MDIPDSRFITCLPVGRFMIQKCMLKASLVKITEYLVYLLLFLLPWQTRLILRPGNGWEYKIVGIFGTEMLLWLILLLIVTFYVRHIKAARKIDLRFLFFVALAAINFWIVPDKLVAVQQLIHVLEAGILFWLLVGSQINRLNAIYAFLGGLSLQAVLAMYQFLSQSSFASRFLGVTLHEAAVGGTSVVENLGGRWLRAYGGLPHPNILGGYMALGIVLVALVLQCSSVNRRQRHLLWLVGALLSTALFFTFSRGAWLALFISLLVYGFIDLRNKKIFQSFSLLIFGETVLIFIILSLIFTPLLSSRLTGQGRLESQAISERLGGYGEAWALFKKHPLLGVGASNYTGAVYSELDSSREPWAYQPVHNSFLLAFVELGVVGTVLMFIAFMGILKILDIKDIFNRKYLISNIKYPVSITCCLILNPYFLFLVIGLFDHYLWSLYSGLMLMAVGLGLTVKKE